MNSNQKLISENLTIEEKRIKKFGRFFNNGKTYRNQKKKKKNCNISRRKKMKKNANHCQKKA